MGLRNAIFVDQAPLQNRAPDWIIGSRGCYDAASLAALQAALHADMSAFADGAGVCSEQRAYECRRLSRR